MDEVMRKAHSWVNENIDQITVALITNLEPCIQEKNKNENLRLADRYFSQKIISEFIIGFREVGIYTRVFENEAKYIEELGSLKYPVGNRKLNFVYNLTEPGLGAGGISLISAVSKFYGLICCNSDPHSSTMGRHKFHSYCVMKEAGPPVPPSWWYIGDGVWAAGNEPEIGKVVIAKSTYESCSVGMNETSIFSYDGDIKILESHKNRMQQPVFVQEYIPGKEVSVPVLIGDSISVLDPVLNFIQDPEEDDIFLCENAVFNGPDLRKIKFTPSKPGLVNDLKTAAAQSSSALGFKGISRIDFRICESGKFYVIDVGAVPVLYKGSSVQLSALWSGIKFNNLLEIMLYYSFLNQISTQE